MAVTVCALPALAAPLLYAAYAVDPMTFRVRLEMRESQAARTMESSWRVAAGDFEMDQSCCTARH
jgi:hypothetical protein